MKIRKLGKDYWALIKWFIIALMLVAAYSLFASDLDIVEGDVKEGVSIQDAISKKGYYIVRIMNYRERRVTCYLFNDEAHYYQKIKARAGKVSDWYRGPSNQIFDWYCK